MAVNVTVRSSLLAEVAPRAGADGEQEANEVLQLTKLPRHPETAQPYTSTQRLLEVYLRQEFPAAGDDPVGYVPETSEFGRADRGAAGEDHPYDLIGEGAALTRRLRDSGRSPGLTQTSAGEMRWAIVAMTTGQVGDPGGTLIIAELPGVANSSVNSTARLVLFVSLSGPVLTAAIALLVGGQVLAPVRTVRPAVTGITERDLTQRLPVHGRDDIAALTTTSNIMLDRLDRAFGGRGKFVYDASHKLRTPITIVRGQPAVMGDDRKDREATTELVTVEFDWMNRIFSDLLIPARAKRPCAPQRWTWQRTGRRTWTAIPGRGARFGHPGFGGPSSVWSRQGGTRWATS